MCGAGEGEGSGEGWGGGPEGWGGPAGGWVGGWVRPRPRPARREVEMERGDCGVKVRDTRPATPSSAAQLGPDVARTRTQPPARGPQAEMERANPWPAAPHQVAGLGRAAAGRGAEPRLWEVEGGGGRDARSCAAISDVNGS